MWRKLLKKKIVFLNFKKNEYRNEKYVVIFPLVLLVNKSYKNSITFIKERRNNN